MMTQKPKKTKKAPAKPSKAPRRSKARPEPSPAPPKSPFFNEPPLFAPRGVDAEGRPLRCSCGCGRVADTVNWGSDEPASWNCFIERIVEAAKLRDAEREVSKAEKIRRMQEGRTIARGEEPANRRATA